MDIKNDNSDAKSKNNNPTQYQQREKTKLQLMKKYNISSEEAEKVIENIINETHVLKKKKQKPERKQKGKIKR